MNICLNRPPGCDAAVERLLYPVVKRVANSDDLEFSIVLVRASLHEVRAAIDDFAAGKMRRMDFYRPRGTIGRWHTKLGRIPDATPLPVGTAMWDAVEQHIRQAEPLAHSRFDVFLHDSSLIYLNEACTAADMATRFFLHVPQECRRSAGPPEAFPLRQPQFPLLRSLLQGPTPAASRSCRCRIMRCPAFRPGNSFPGWTAFGT